jgi:hypothetical protein
LFWQHENAIQEGSSVLDQLESNLDFGFVVKILGISVKKEAGDELETSGWRNIVKPQTTKEF